MTSYIDDIRVYIVCNGISCLYVYDSPICIKVFLVSPALRCLSHFGIRIMDPHVSQEIYIVQTSAQTCNLKQPIKGRFQEVSTNQRPFHF